MRGVIFFSSTSSSAKFFWYFSQLEPVAEGMFALQAKAAVVVVMMEMEMAMVTAMLGWQRVVYVCVCVACTGQTCLVGGGGGLNEGVGAGQVGKGCLFVMRTAVGGHDGDGGRASAVRAWRVLVLVPLSRPAARIKIIQVARAARDHTHPRTHQPTIPRLHPPYNTHHSTTQHGSPSCKRRRRRRRKCCLQGTLRTDTCA